MAFVPAVIGIPGGVELIVILLIFVLLFGVPLTLLVVLGYTVLSDSGESGVSEDRLEELESEVELLRERIEETDE